ncbi:deoxynucleotide monophosphate kinase family protein [Stutzerimonas nitrititolerans]|uniref:deoxynucleotide monophosphate kinase family protein n=1 Tax=Stutzerimonas nitrititolerans TaxID=2482751 RepID=UPI00289A75DC|nr:deoxynucleotide monophosphate kinase [Stutzerimonas nitrititolerans]
MNHLLIGLHGLARTGKDTAAAYLTAQFALYSYAFADPLKAAIAQLFNLTHEHMEGTLKEALLPGIGKSPRQLMQLLGTEWGRQQVHPELWLLLAQQNIGYQLEVDQSHYNGVVIRDVRFENEAKWIRRQGGHVVHILRPDAQAVALHSSESGIAIHDNDSVVHNEGTLDDLYRQLDRIMCAAASAHRHRSVA